MFLKNPSNIQLKFDDEPEEQNQNTYRSIELTQNSIIKRYMCQYYHERFVEPG